jgi:hypothetical protein
MPISRCSFRSRIRPSTTVPTAPLALARFDMSPPYTALGRLGGEDMKMTEFFVISSIFS